MQTYLVEKTENSVTLGFKEANLTLITPLVDALYGIEDVTLVRYSDKHPELSDRTLYVEVKEGDALEAVKKASLAVSEYYSVINE